MSTRPNYPAWLSNATDVDLAVAVLLDRADADAAEAAELGRPRSAAAGVRKLRHLANGLAELGTGEAFETPTAPAVRRDPAELGVAS